MGGLGMSFLPTGQLLSVINGPRDRRMVPPCRMRADPPLTCPLEDRQPRTHFPTPRPRLPAALSHSAPAAARGLC